MKATFIWCAARGRAPERERKHPPIQHEYGREASCAGGAMPAGSAIHCATPKPATNPAELSTAAYMI